MRRVIVVEECKPLETLIEGKLVVIKAEDFKVEYRDAKYQLVLATGGFGCDGTKLGNAVFVTEVYPATDSEKPESYRRERYQLAGMPTKEMIAEWESYYGKITVDYSNFKEGE